MRLDLTSRNTQKDNEKWKKYREVRRIVLVHPKYDRL
jgi:hypothetical protein